ncbi:hypothetical protein IAQ61_009940, partial [Plenodomus lingam]|uniref:Predicted protein n=1 Tax=Leptosphaeria maculans (strain JN3 / isolate v23.1.3 / race Av1-4-5-6-7-8) TaxID=985895 RepID=E4ZSH2_LEPMJ
MYVGASSFSYKHASRHQIPLPMRFTATEESWCPSAIQSWPRESLGRAWIMQPASCALPPTSPPPPTYTSSTAHQTPATGSQHKVLQAIALVLIGRPGILFFSCLGGWTQAHGFTWRNVELEPRCPSMTRSCVAAQGHYVLSLSLL